MAFKCSMARESPVAFAANVAANAGVDLHVLLQSSLGLEPLPAQQAEDGHVGPCRAKTPRSVPQDQHSQCSQSAEHAGTSGIGRASAGATDDWLSSTV